MSYAKRQRQAWTAERLREQAQQPMQWSPLDGGLETEPEYIPEIWIGPHVGVRMIEAFRTLSNLPNRKLGGATGYWPQYLPEFGDNVAREQSDAEIKEERAHAQNRARVMPSAQDITRMDIVICWAGRYLTIEQAKLVQYIALARSRDCDVEAIAHRLRRDQKQMRRANRNGLDLIATGLRIDLVEVF